MDVFPRKAGRAILTYFESAASDIHPTGSDPYKCAGPFIELEFF
jgi:hypothetical protein